MSFRTDKLILLLDTGTSAPVRRTAAKQLADLTLKTFRISPSIRDEKPDTTLIDSQTVPDADIKPDIPAVGEDGETKPKVEDGGPVVLDGTVAEDDAWSDVLDTISRLLPLLRSRSSETRNAASHALGLLAACLPVYTVAKSDSSGETFTSPAVDVKALLSSGETLLASTGREYIAKPSAGDRAKRRKAMMGSLGLGEVGWGDDVDNVIGEEEEDPVTKETNGKKEASEAPPTTKDIFEGLSARQITMLKRKKGNIAEEANKMRRLNAQASGITPASSLPPTPAASPPKSNMVSASNSQNDIVTIDPGAKARAAATQATGAFEPDLDADGNPVAANNRPSLPLRPGLSPWVVVLSEVITGLADPTWQTRHGSSLAILEVIRSSTVSTAIPPAFLLATARELLTLLTLDRFGDFLGDTVVAPVREAAAQALGVLLKYLDLDGVKEVHGILMEMVRQPWATRGQDGNKKDKAEGEKFRWEVRHAGLLGLKYEVAVRSDLLASTIKEEVKAEAGEEPGSQTQGSTFLEDVVDATMMALRDVDDDVRAVAAAALTPITNTLAEQLPYQDLSRVVDILWDCLAEGGDELGSSTGAVMDLLGAMVSHAQVIDVMAEEARGQGDRSRRNLITRIYAFTRHPIASVRLAVGRALYTFATVPALPKSDWLDEVTLSLLFENLVLEERGDIRETSFAAFEAALRAASHDGDLGHMVESVIQDWYSLVMVPVGAEMHQSYFLPGKRKTTGHNVDKSMLAGDMTILSPELVMQTRLAGAKALALLRSYAPEEEPFLDVDLLPDYLGSTSAHQVYMASAIVVEWAREKEESHANLPFTSITETDPFAKRISESIIALVERGAPATFAEMGTLLKRIQSDCQALLVSFSTEGKVSKDRIPELPRQIDPLSNSLDCFSLSTAHTAITTHFNALAKLLPKGTSKIVLPLLQEKQRKVMASVGRYSVMKERYDIQVFSGLASALISLRTMPPKMGPVIKAIMDSIKKEENEVLQARSASSIAAMIQLCASPFLGSRPNPTDKVIRNLVTFLCQDVSINPIFSPAQPGATDGILSLKEDKVKKAVKPGQEEEESEEAVAMRIMRRGALMAFKELAAAFGGELFDRVPRVWEGLSSALLSTYTERTSEAADELLREKAATGQDIIDSLTTLRLISPSLHPDLRGRVLAIFPAIIGALQSCFSVVRNVAAKCLAALCDVITEEGMKLVIDHVVPLIGDAKRVSARQGSVEAIHHIIQALEIKALPYVLFLIVPILGRMSDPEESVRLLSTSTFASLVKMVPLEAGIPNPPGFSAELLAKRDDERQFLMQLLDGSKAEQYRIPIDIKADLRQYQRDGVSWLAFLAKYQLHGILCDDMGLGKSLQSICIIGSKHHERAQRHKLTSSVDSAHLPSLIVCPPTLTGHWYHEILKFTDDLRPIQYVGSAAERAAMRSRLTASTTDIVIASYETVRSDIAELGKIDWLYCVLDEGHIIKNAKTKLSAAVKQLRAQHRLLLSGTPIQNNVLELWSLFDFLMPGFLGSERVFNDRFSKPILADRDGKATPKERELAAAALESLHKQVLPFLLRRLKEDVLSDLPPKIIQDYHCELSDIQKLLYDEFSRSTAAEEAGEQVSSDAAAGSGQQHVFQSLQYLRKLCNHPALVLDKDAPRTTELLARVGSKAGLHDISHAPKMEALKQLLLDCGIGVPPAEKTPDEMSQHRVLIFCQLRPMLDLIERDLFATLMPSVTYMRMDGSTDPKRRHGIVQTFNADPRIDVLLLTTSVGGLGLNLTGADTVIFVDHDWNPMKDLQAMDRAHRLGQKKVVNVYRLITRGTLEEKIMGLQRFKLNIASSVVTQQNAGLGSMNTGEVLDLFKVSAEDEPGKRKKEGGAAGPVSASKILEGLEDLPPDDEYAELSLANFMSKV